MSNRTIMQRFARWHIWLGWLVAVPLLLWTLSGLVMIARPIETVRGSDLRVEAAKQPLPPGLTPALPFLAPDQPEILSYTLAMRAGKPTARVQYPDGSAALFDAASGAKLSPLGAAEAREVVLRGIKAKAEIAELRLFPADKVPFDFRKPMPVWQVTLKDGTHIYVGRDSGEIEAVRTSYWRFYDFMWGLHIMDPGGREDFHHPLLILATVLALINVVFGVTLLFRRRKVAR
jgi:uncharacterized iron-regulated membrane protein